MSDPIHIIRSKKPDPYNFSPPEPVSHRKLSPLPPDETDPSLEDYDFSSSPPTEEGYLSNSPKLSAKMKITSLDRGLDRRVRHIPSHRRNPPKDADVEEGSEFEGHNLIQKLRSNSPERPAKKTSVQEKFSLRRSPPTPKKKMSVEDSRAVRLEHVKPHSNSSPDLLPSQVTYKRANSEIFHWKKKSSTKEKIAYPISSDIREMHLYALGKIQFHPNEAATQLFTSYMHFKENREAMIQSLVEFQKGLPKDWHLERFYTVLTTILNTEGGEELICDYFHFPDQMTSGEVDPFTHYAIGKLSKGKVPSTQILAIISRITAIEIMTQTRETLFREPNLPSAFCRDYGNLLWGKDLKDLVKTIERLLPPKTLPSHSLKYGQAQSLLGEEAGRSPDAVEQKLDENAAQFRKFARKAIPKIFELPIPEQVQEMFISRRRQIIDFLSKNPLEKNEDVISASRTYISEVFYLRLVIPHLIGTDAPPLLKDVFISLAKVLQCLADEEPFGETHDPIYQKLNPLFDKFIKSHRRYIDDNSLPSGPTRSDTPELVWV